MSKKKIAGIAVGGFLGLTMIGNAVGAGDKPKPKPFTPPAVAITHAGHDASHAITSAGKKVGKIHPKPKHHTPSLAVRYDHGDLFCGGAGDGYRTHRETAWCAVHHPSDDAKTPADNSCFSKASSLAAVEALSGNVGGAVAAGKIALDKAGTGDQC